MNKQLSKLITPPDFVKSKGHNVVLIDPEWTEVEDLSYLLMTLDKVFNVYVYRDEMQDIAWLTEAIKKSKSVIVNTVNTSVSKLKDKLVANQNVYYYGSKKFIMNNNRIEKPIDFFAQFALFKKEKNVAQ